MGNPKALKQKLMVDARTYGICLEGYETMRGRNISQLIDYYIQNPDWCLEREYPDLQTLATSFADIQDKGVYVNHTFNGETLNELQAYIFHNCKGNIRVRLNREKAIIPMLYFANNCDMIVQCDENISVPLYIFGDNTIATDNSNAFKIFKNKILGESK